MRRWSARASFGARGRFLGLVLGVLFAGFSLSAPPVGADPASTYATAADGAAKGTTGGGTGPVVAVSSLSGTGPGTLREAVKAPGPRVVVFSVSGTLTINDPISVASNITIDGRGADVSIVGAGLRFDGVENVIVRNLRISGGKSSSSDAISVARGSKRIWIDHNELDSFGDGLIDVTEESTAVTISWNVLRDHGKAMLLGSGRADGSPQLVDISVHNNLLQKTGERNPFVRHGRFHIWNNVIEKFGYEKDSGYNMRVGCGAIALYDANVVIAGSNDRAFTVEDEKCDAGREPALAIRDSNLGKLKASELDPDRVPARSELSPGAQVQPADDALVAAVKEGAGWHDVPSVVSNVKAPPAPTTTRTEPANDGGEDDGTGGSGPILALGVLLLGVALVIGALGVRAVRTRHGKVP